MNIKPLKPLGYQSGHRKLNGVLICREKFDLDSVDDGINFLFRIINTIEFLKPVSALNCARTETHAR